MTPARILNRLKFILERMILRGAMYRLLVIALFMGLLAVAAGLLVFALAGAFSDPGEAIWWAFLRLTDPGYLGDDEGLLVRTISTILTILGFVLFVGALIAILTQWLNQTIEDLEHGYTPVALHNHLVILGWTNRTAAIVAELLLSEGRVRRLLGRRGVKDLRVAILANEAPERLRQELRDRLGRLWSGRNIILRSGTPLRIEHLRRVDFSNAAAILLPAREFGQQRIGADTQIVKTLLSLKNHPVTAETRELPLVVAEIFDADKISTARRAYGGKIEILASDAIISRLIAQNVRHRGLSHIYGELLTHGRGNEIYIRPVPSFVGQRFHSLGGAFEHGIPLGVARTEGTSYETILNPADDFVVEPEDKLIVLARSYEQTEPQGTPVEQPPRRTSAERRSAAQNGMRRVLVLGWSHRIPALLREFDSYSGEQFQIDVMSIVSEEERLKRISRRDSNPERVSIRMIEGDYASPAELRAADPGSYDNIVLLGSDWLESGEEADARTILAYLLLRDMLPADSAPEILIELIDPQNLSLFRRRPGEVLISPMILSHMLAQVALRPELRAVFDNLFGPQGAELAFLPALSVVGKAGPHTFRQVQLAAAERGEIAIGIRQAPEGDSRHGSLRLNPPRHHSWEFGEGDEVVVLTTS